MKNYNRIERNFAKLLESFPATKLVLKNLYHSLNYFIYRTEKQSYINTLVNLSDCQQENDHFFGYFDKTCWSTEMNNVLFHRKCDDDCVEIVVYNLISNKSLLVGKSKAWNWQQGAMLQWMPNHNDLIIYNDVVHDQLVAKISSINNPKVVDVLPYPIQAISPNGDCYISLNYKRLFLLRPDYGYSCTVNNFYEDMEDDIDGLWLVGVPNHKSDLIISLTDLKNNYFHRSMKDAKHKVNHVIFSPDGKRIAFMHRWISSAGKYSRLYTSNVDGTDLQLLADDKMVSHYSWYDNDHILAWCRKNDYGDHYYLIEDKTAKYKITGENVLDSYGDGHPSFSPN